MPRKGERWKQREREENPILLAVMTPKESGRKAGLRSAAIRASRHLQLLSARGLNGNMSYDVGFQIGGSRVEFGSPLDIRGGTYALGGTREAWMNITYNYAEIFRALFGNDGIRSLYGKTAATVSGEVQRAIGAIPDVVAIEKACSCHNSMTCYWATTAGNAKDALENLLILALEVPSAAIFEGD